MVGWEPGFRIEGINLSGRSRGFFYCSKNWKNPSCQDNSGKWVWSAYHNNKKEPPFWLLDPPPQSHTILGKEVDRSAVVPECDSEMYNFNICN